MAMAQVYLYKRPARSVGKKSDEGNLGDTEPDNPNVNGGGMPTVTFGIGGGPGTNVWGSSNNIFGSGMSIVRNGSIFRSSNNIFGKGGNIGKGGKPGFVVVNNQKQN